jgi:hypothetical protein
VQVSWSELVLVKDGCYIKARLVSPHSLAFSFTMQSLVLTHTLPLW